MLNLKKFAVTGGLSSGKSTVCALFQKRGGHYIDADAIVHRLYSSSSVCKQKVLNLLGQTVLTDNQLDRKKIANIVFTHPDKLTLLESIVHPMVYDEISSELSRIESQDKNGFAVVEIPLLFELGWETEYDATICVVADEECMKRRFSSLGNTEEDSMRRLERQMPIKEKAQRADYVIKNTGSKEDLEKNVKTIMDKTFGR